MSGADKGRHCRYWSADGTLAKTAFGIDCDRIIYSTAFRRLAGVTQVVSADETALFHNRLTHSMKVAQVGIRIAHKIQEISKDRNARRIIERYGGIDSRVVRAACLAHDLGHPPFGHIAESELKKALDPRSTADAARGFGQEHQLPKDSFEGNAQSFRIVTRLAAREPGDGGGPAALDLTRATLRALLKYPWLKEEILPREDAELTHKRRDKWGAYESESKIAFWARGAPDGRIVDFHGRQRIEYRSIEAQAMDWADDITYAVHDIEDFFRAGLIPLHTLRRSTEDFNNFFSMAWQVVGKKIAHAVDERDVKKELQKFRATLFPEDAFSGSRRDRERLHEFASQLIGTATESLSIESGGLLLPDKIVYSIVEILKEMTFYYVIHRPALRSAQLGQARLISELYRSLVEWVVDEGKNLDDLSDGRVDTQNLRFPTRLRDYLRIAFNPDPRYGCVSYTLRQKISRAVTDYIVSLTEAQAVALGTRLLGTSQSSMVESWIQA